MRREATIPLGSVDNDLLEEVLAAPNFKRAWKQVRANNGTPGIDGLRIDDVIVWSKLPWKQCEFKLRDGSYRPSPVRRVEIESPIVVNAYWEFPMCLIE